MERELERERKRERERRREEKKEKERGEGKRENPEFILIPLFKSLEVILKIKS